MDDEDSSGIMFEFVSSCFFLRPASSTRLCPILGQDKFQFDELRMNCVLRIHMSSQAGRVTIVALPSWSHSGQDPFHVYFLANLVPLLFHPLRLPPSVVHLWVPRAKLSWEGRRSQGAVQSRLRWLRALRYLPVVFMVDRAVSSKAGTTTTGCGLRRFVGWICDKTSDRDGS